MSEQISLGQLFLLRRNVKNEIGELEHQLTPLGFHREDQEAPVESYNEVFSTLEQKRDYLLKIDTLINEANSLSRTVEFNGERYSLNMARHIKTHLAGAQGSIENQIRHLEIYVKRQEQEMFFDTSLTPPAMRPKKFGYKILADLPRLKADSLKLKKDVRLLDSLIQKADWTIMVDAPQE
jgi:hypothetical protein